MSRGSLQQAELLQAEKLLKEGAEKVWGWESPAGKQRVLRRISWILQTLNLGPGKYVLEYGCGTGLFTGGVAKSGACITAGDLSPLLLQEAREKIQSSNVRFVQTDLESPDSSLKGPFDAVYGVSILHHLNLDRALPILRERLKSGGLFAFSEPNLNNPICHYSYSSNPRRRIRFGLTSGEMAFRFYELKGYFERYGFVVDDISFRDFMHPAFPKWSFPFIRVVQTICETLPLVRSMSGSLWIRGHLPFTNGCI